MDAMGLRSESGGSAVTHEDSGGTTITPATPRPNTLEEVSAPSNQGEQQQPESPSGSEIGLPESPQNRSFSALAEATADQGYDTDGEMGPFFDGVEEEGSLEGVEEVEIGSERRNESNNATAVEVNVGEENSEIQSDSPQELTVEGVDRLVVKDLRDELGKRGLSKRGKKSDLVERLKKAVEEKLPLLENVIVNEGETLVGAEDGFAAQAKWKILQPNEEDVVDEAALQTIGGVRFHNPTVRDNIVEGLEGAKKMNYEQRFDRPQFSSSCEQPVRGPAGNFVYDR